MHFWLVKESIVVGERLFCRDMYWKFAIWAIVSIGLSAVCFTQYFIPDHSTDAQRVFGWGYRTYVVVALALYMFLIVDAAKTIRHLDGARRIELQVWLLGGCSVAASVLSLMALRSYTRDSRFIEIQPILILVFYVGTVVAITTHRIFDARQIVLVFLQRTSLVLGVAAIAYTFHAAAILVLPDVLGFVGSIAVALFVRSIMSHWLDRVFEFYPQGNIARHAVLSAAQRESKVESLKAEFCNILKGWGQSDTAIVASGEDGRLFETQIPLLKLESTSQAMRRQLKWVTPERMARERSTPERAELAEFLRVHQLGVLVFAEGPSLSVLVGVGVGASRRPYTYPQVTQLMELASIMESALERAHFSAKVQRTEQLATVGLVGASLAHEIRNPLVSIKTFVQLLPTHHQDPVFRERFFRLIGSEVDRIDQLTEQLLDLSAPRAYAAVQVALHEILLSSLDLVRAKAADKQVEFSSDFAARPDQVFTDPAAARQVMLNLCFNAIQAVEAHRGDRCWVRISTRNVEGGVEMAVADSGPGIAPEMRERLFQPFQTTKSTGFGLGLAICRDILANLQASISVDPPEAGKGATFRVTYPCQVSSS